MSKFNWQLASAEDIAIFISDGKENVLRQQINYYKLCNNKIMLDRIIHAKKIALAWELEKQLVNIKSELGAYGAI